MSRIELYEITNTLKLGFEEVVEYSNCIQNGHELEMKIRNEWRYKKMNNNNDDEKISD